MFSSPSRRSGVACSASDVRRLRKSSPPSPRSYLSSITPSVSSLSERSASRASFAGAVTLTPQSVTAESASEHSIRPVRFFCIVIHLLGQSYVRTCADMT